MRNAHTPSALAHMRMRACVQDDNYYVVRSLGPRPRPRPSRRVIYDDLILRGWNILKSGKACAWAQTSREVEVGYVHAWRLCMYIASVAASAYRAAADY